MGFWNITVMASTIIYYIVFLDSVNGGGKISHYVFVPSLTQGCPIFMQKLTLFTVAAKPQMEKKLPFPSPSSKLILSYSLQSYEHYPIHLNRKIDKTGKNRCKLMEGFNLI